MGRRKGKVTCRKCGMVFSGVDEWASFEDCGNSDCYCPKVKEAMEAAMLVINKARQVPLKATIITKEHDVPPRFGNRLKNKEDTFVYVEVPTIQTFQVSPIKGHKK